MRRRRKPVYWSPPKPPEPSNPGDIPPTEINEDGDKLWMNAAGELHRDGGLPAVERANGNKQWWVNGARHRDGGLPAVDRFDGDKEWWVNGVLHRDGGLPAIEFTFGFKQWWIHGVQQPRPKQNST